MYDLTLVCDIESDDHVTISERSGAWTGYTEDQPGVYIEAYRDTDQVAVTIALNHANARRLRNWLNILLEEEQKHA